MPGEEFPRPGVRLTDAEREHAVGLLFVAHRDGRISLDELDRCSPTCPLPVSGVRWPGR